MPLPPLSRLRKGVVFFTILLFIFILSRLLFIKKNDSPSLPEKAVPSLRTEMCLMVTSGGPVNVDTIFHLKKSLNRIYAYSSFAYDFNVADTLWHIWYYNSERIKAIPCTLRSTGCYSYLPADSLRKGDWSLDTRQKGILMNIRQFKIED